DPVGDDCDRRHGKVDPPGIAGQEGFVDLEAAGSGIDQGLRFGVQPPGQGDDEVVIVGVGTILDPPGEREGPGEGKLDGPVGEGGGEAVLVGQAQHPRGRLPEGDVDPGVVVVEVVELVRLGDDQAGDATQQVVDVVVAAQLAVGHDVDPGPLLILEGRRDGHPVVLFEVGPADPAAEMVVLESLEPVGNRV